MKRILLTTTALTMTAGIAAAEVSITGDFRLGFNDTDSNDGVAGTAAVAPVYNPITGLYSNRYSFDRLHSGTNAR